MINEFIERKCPHCGERKNELIDGEEFILRCQCDWENGFKNRLISTVHPDFWKNEKKMIDWSPTIFKNGGNTQFTNFVKIQKANVIYKLNEFYFKETTLNNKKITSLQKSIEYARNLFIRGPANSGRGLLVACIKTFAAMKDISTTPLPGEWSTFKFLLQESTSYGDIGIQAKSTINEQYRDVKLMTIENLRSEIPFSLLDDKPVYKKIRGSSTFDDLLARKSSVKGSMVFSSLDFIGQFKDSISDAMPEILLSDKTMVILMLSCNEIESLLNGIEKRCNDLIRSCNILTGKKVESKKTIVEKKSEEENLIQLKYLLYTSDIFDIVPSSDSINLKTYSMILKESIKNKSANEKVNEVYEEYLRVKEENGEEYQNNIYRAMIFAIKECKELYPKLSEKELIELGKMISLACKSKDEIDEYMKGAIELRKMMSGVKK